MTQPLPEPALIVLAGPSGAGKSTWAQRHFRSEEIVSSDDLRAIVGSGRHDLDASADAFRLLDEIVTARVRRGLTCVIDTLGLDTERRRGYLALARAHRMAAVAVVFEAPAALVRQRNARRNRPVPARVLAIQLSRAANLQADLSAESWDSIVTVSGDQPADTAAAAPAVRSVEPSRPSRGSGPEFVLQLSQFGWGEDPAPWLKSVACAAAEAGFAGIALMDHLIQIPQVGRAWDPIPEPWVTLGLLAGLDLPLRLGTLVSPVTFRPAGITAKAVATLASLSRGGAFLGVGAGWWPREHAAFGLPFPAAAERVALLEASVETVRALLAPGTKPYAGTNVSLPETTNYPRPGAGVPIIVGARGPRTLGVAARLADGCNIPSDAERLDQRIGLWRRLCEQAGRDPGALQLTVLDVPVVGADRDEVWGRVEQFRGRTAAATYLRTHHAGTFPAQRARYAELAEKGVGTVFIAPPHLRSAADVLALAPMLG